MRVTYHDPCHLGRYGGIENGIYDPPREILKSIPGVELVEMNRIRHYSFCCGSGGGVKSAYPEVAANAAMMRWEEAMDVAGTKIMTSCCPFCEINLGEAAKNIEGARVLDVMQLVDMALGD
jgi:heterodisulfide reductase subunit D